MGFFDKKPEEVLAKQFRDEKEEAKKLPLDKIGEAFQKTSRLIDEQRAAVQQEVDDKRKKLAEAKRWKVGFWTLSVISGFFLGVAAIAAAVVAIATAPLWGPVVGVVAIMRYMKDKREERKQKEQPVEENTIADKVVNKVVDKAKKTIFEVVRDNTWGIFVDGRKDMEEDIVNAQGEVAAAEEGTKGIFAKIKEVEAQIKAERQIAASLIALNESFVTKDGKKITDAFVEAYNNNPQRCIDSIKNSLLLDELKSAIFSKENISKLASLSGDGVQIKGLLLMLITPKDPSEKIDLFATMLDVVKLVKSYDSKIDSKMGEVLLGALDVLQAAVDEKDVAAVAPKLLTQLQDAVKAKVTPEGMQTIDNYIAKSMQTDLYVRHDCLRGGVGSLNKEDFRALIREFDGNTTLTAFEFIKPKTGNINEDVKRYVQSVCLRNGLDKLEKVKSFGEKDAAGLVRLVEDLGGSLTVTESIKEHEKQYAEKAQLLRGKIKELRASKQEYFSPEQLQKIDTFFAKEVQAELLAKHPCLKGGVGGLDEKDFAALQKEMEPNETLLTFELKEPTLGNISPKVKEYVAYICGRNQLLRLVVNKKTLSEKDSVEIANGLEKIDEKSREKVLGYVKGKVSPSVFAAIQKTAAVKFGAIDVVEPKTEPVPSKNGAAPESALPSAPVSAKEPELGHESTVKPIPTQERAGVASKNGVAASADSTGAIFGKLKLGETPEKGVAKKHNEEIQDRLMATEGGYNCLQGRAGFLNKGSFRELTEELDDNYELTSFNFEREQFKDHSPNSNVRKYVENICKRNQLCALVIGGLPTVKVQEFVNIFKSMHSDIDGDYLKGEYKMSQDNLYRILLQVEKRNPVAVAAVMSAYFDAKDPSDTVQNLQELLKANPQAFRAMLKYNFNKPSPDVEAEYKVQLIEGLLKNKELFKPGNVSNPTVKAMYGFVADTVSSGKGKALDALKGALEQIEVAKGDKKSISVSEGVKADAVKSVKKILGHKKEEAESPRQRVEVGNTFVRGKV